MGVILSVLGLLVGLFVPKFIGLESIITIELIYYSQLLISDASKWPVGFSQFKYLKAATGYNDLISLTYYLPSNNMNLKLSKLYVQKTII